MRTFTPASGLLRAFLVLFLLSTNALSRGESLRTKIQRIIDNAGGRVGVAIIGPGGGDTLAWNGSGRFPMQSVYKFPLALAVLHCVDGGTLALDQKVHVSKGDLLPQTWSPLREKYPRGDVDVTLDELLQFTVSESDNNGCDILFRLMGGTEAVNRHIHSLGLADIAIVATEAEMHRGGDVQFRNWSTPIAMARLLSMFDRDSIISESSRDYLWQLMVKTSTGPGRLKGSLPEGTVVAHKTGSSGVDRSGIAAATNDAGVIVLPDGRHVAIAVFVSNSPANENARDGVIAGIARAAWDSFAGP